MTDRIWLLVGGVMASLLSSSTMAADSSETAALQAQVKALARQLQLLEQKLEASQTAAPAPAAAPDPQVEVLDQKVKVLERKLEISDEAAATAKKDTPVVTASEKGFALTSADKSFQIKLRGLLQADGRAYLDDGNAANIDDTFIMRRVRPTIEGTVFEKYDFRFTPDFGNGRSIVVDAYGEARFEPWAKVRAGKFKPPVSLERLQSGADIKFIERGYPSGLAPNRDIGVQLGGDYENGAINYGLGIFNGVPDGQSSDNLTSADRDTHDSKDFAGRLFAHPFQFTDIFALQGLGIGIAGTVANETGDPSGTLLSTYSSPGQNVFFSYRGNRTLNLNSGGTVAFSDATFAAGERARIYPQAYYFYGPFGAMGEYVSSAQEVRRNIQTGNSATGAIRTTGFRTDTLDNTAWQIQLSYVLTGEDNTFKSVKPKNPFKIGDGGWGAVELAFRYQELTVDEDAFTGGANSFANPTTAASEADSWGFAANWYLNNNLKFVLDYNQTSFDGGGGGTLTAPIDRSDEHALFGRMQVAF